MKVNTESGPKFGLEETRFMSVFSVILEDKAYHVTPMQMKVVFKLGPGTMDNGEWNDRQLDIIKRRAFSITAPDSAPKSPTGKNFPVVRGPIGTKAAKGNVDVSSTPASREAIDLKKSLVGQNPGLSLEVGN